MQKSRVDTAYHPFWILLLFFFKGPLRNQRDDNKVTTLRTPSYDPCNQKLLHISHTEIKQNCKNKIILLHLIEQSYLL